MIYASPAGTNDTCWETGTVEAVTVAVKVGVTLGVKVAVALELGQMVGVVV